MKQFHSYAPIGSEGGYWTGKANTSGTVRGGSWFCGGGELASRGACPNEAPLVRMDVGGDIRNGSGG